MFDFFTENRKSIMFILDSIKKHKNILYIFIFGEILAGIFLIIFPIIAKYETDQLVEKNTDFFGMFTASPIVVFITIIGLVFFLKFIEKCTSSIVDIIKYKYTRIFEIDYESSLYKRVSYAPLGVFLNSRNKRIVSQTMYSGNDSSNFLRGVVGPMITNTIAITGIFFVISLFYLPLIGIILISSMIIYFFQKWKETYGLKQEAGRNYENEYKIDRLKYEISENAHQVTVNGGNTLMEELFVTYSHYQTQLIQRLQIQETSLEIASFFVQNVGTLLIKTIVGYLVLQGTQSIGFMTMTLLYVSQIESIFQSFQNMKFQKDRFEDNLKKLGLFLILTEKKEDVSTKKEISFGKLSFQNIIFSYPNVSQLELQYFDILEARIKKYGNTLNVSDEDELHMIAEARKDAQTQSPIILQDVSLEFSPGYIYGLVGKNGAGKTTITHLLLSFFHNYTGNIVFSGINYKDILAQDIYKNCSLVSQIPYVLMDFSFRENLLLGVEVEHSDEVLFSYLEKFGIDKKIKKLRLGLDARIGYDSDISGGEKQIICLIRTILQNRPILIMDEGTNQLDAENELLIMEELMKHKKDKIIIFITHRMTTIRKADIIYCLEKGKITATGNHQQLLAGNNIYKNFWKKQVES